ncbi:MAG: hypothetical protein O7G85_13950, partial [Planctomycetota bacterium]|nr:hypothetical protein [Planctomycetota bacterium]
NIRHFEPIATEHGLAQNIALVSRVVLAGAYFISVSYYLQLLAVFLLKIMDVESQIAAHTISSALLVSIGVIGMWRGLGILEAVEKYAVSLNLAMIGALLVGLLVYNIQHVTSGQWTLPDVSSTIDLKDVRILLGLLIVVQGFETSRYLGTEHPPEQRIAAMRAAQILSAMIYLAFVGLATVLFHDGIGSDVTAIIGMVKPVAIVLPVLLTIAAIGSQFSAAVADNAGAGGLIEEITHRKLPMRYAYLLIMLVTVALTWETNVNAIITYASRAFALYYMLQCVVALLVAMSNKDLPRRQLHLLLFGVLAVLCLLVFSFGLSSE